MLTVDRVHKDWAIETLFDDEQWCPVCLGHAFGYTEGGEGVYCSRCSARFVVRMTAGDPGVVIDCWPCALGKFAIRPSEKPIVPGTNMYYFWQVLKTCDDGLAGRVRWLSATARYNHYYTLAKAQADPIFSEVYQFHPSRTVEVQTAALWQASAQKAEFERRKALVEVRGDAWYAIFQEEATAHFAFEEAHKSELLSALPDCPEGLYFKNQCEIVYEAHYWVAPCVPKAGEKPRVTRPFYVHKEED